MFHIIFVLLSLATLSLVAMEPVTIKPSNSSSGVSFFIKSISHNLPDNYQLPKEIKHKLLTTYVALINNEYNSSHRYNELVDAFDYMNLNTDNKQYIQKLFSTTKTAMKIDNINNNKQIIFGDFPNAQIDYQKMLQLPLNIRRTIASKYSDMILIKTTEENLNQKEVRQEEKFEYGISALIMASICIFLDAYFIKYPTCILSLAWIQPLQAIPKLIYDKCRPLTSNQAFKFYHHNGYKLLPLLPEENEK